MRRPAALRSPSKERGIGGRGLYARRRTDGGPPAGRWPLVGSPIPSAHVRLAATALIALLAYGGVLVSLLRKHDGDISLMVIAGGGLVDPSKTPPGLTVDPSVGGYDGMMFYR